MSLFECCSPEFGVDFASSLTLNPIADPIDVPFRFRNLPKELRFMVYEHALSFESVDKYCSDYLELLGTTSNTQKPAPEVEKVCPSILLVSKDITEEALPILYQTPLNLSYGVFKAHLQDLISPELLRNLRYINISDSGTRHLTPPHHDCFRGLCYAVVELATILRSGHSLKSLTLDYTSDYLSTHLKDCLNVKDKACGIKTWSQNLLSSIKELHNIKQVSISLEWSEEVKQEAIRSMKGPAVGFLRLPLNVRQKIYGYAADHNDGSRALRRATKQLAFNEDPTFDDLTTPNVFLLNKQIESEASEIIYSKPFEISGLFPMVNCTFLKLDDFFGLHLFRKIRHLELSFTDHNHLAMLPTIAAVLKRRRRNKLQSLHLHFAEPRSKRLILAAEEYYPDNVVYSCMRSLNYLRGFIEEVRITGTLPQCFTAPIIHNMGLSCLSGQPKPVQVANVWGHVVDVHVVQGTAFFRQNRGILVEPTGMERIEID